jgi:hypothetical protein
MFSTMILPIYVIINTAGKVKNSSDNEFLGLKVTITINMTTWIVNMRIILKYAPTNFLDKSAISGKYLNSLAMVKYWAAVR